MTKPNSPTRWWSLPPRSAICLRHVNQYLNETLTPQDVLSAFAGLRPLLKSKASVQTGKLSSRPRSRGRCRQRSDQRPGRQVDHLPRHGRRRHRPRAAGAWSGSGGVQDAGFSALRRRGLLGWITGGSWRRNTICPRAPPATWRRSSAPMRPRYWSWPKQEPQLLQPLLPGGAAIRAEAVYAIREEMAQTIEDILARRLGVQFYGWKEAAEAAPAVAQLLAREFAWSEDQTRQAVDCLLGHTPASAPRGGHREPAGSNRGTIDGKLHRSLGSGNHQHALHGLRPRRATSSAPRSGSTRRSIPGRDGWSMIPPRSGAASAR